MHVAAVVEYAVAAGAGIAGDRFRGRADGAGAVDCDGVIPATRAIYHFIGRPVPARFVHAVFGQRRRGSDGVNLSGEGAAQCWTNRTGAGLVQAERAGTYAGVGGDRPCRAAARHCCNVGAT